MKTTIITLAIVAIIAGIGAVTLLIPIHQYAQAGKSIFTPPGPPGVPTPHTFSGWFAACHLGSASPARGANDPHFCP